MTGRTCPGIGRDAHDEDAVVEITQPVHLTVCRDCWQRFLNHRPHPWTERDHR